MAKSGKQQLHQEYRQKSERLFFRKYIFAPGKIGCWVSFLTYCPQRMMNFRVEKLLLLGIDREYENSTILQIMIRINTIKPRRRRYLEAC